MPPLPLSALARQFMVDEPGVRATVRHCVLVLEGPPLEKEEELLLNTSIETAHRLRSGEAVVFPIAKGSQQKNGFPGAVTVGRTANNDIVLDDNTVSRFHAFFRLDPGDQWMIVDADSTAGTWVGGAKLEPSKPRPMADLERIRFGNMELFFFRPDTFFQYLQGHIRP